MRMFSTLAAVVLMVMPVVAQEQAPQAKNDADARIEALMVRMAELEAEVARLRAEKGEAAKEEPKQAEADGAEKELAWEPIEKSSTPAEEAPQTTDERGTGFRCQSCGGSFFLSADAQGKLAELGDYVFCPSCGMACWVRKAGVAEAKDGGKVGRILLRRVRVPQADESNG